MSLIFVTENGATIGIEDNRCYVRLSDNSVRSYPLENIEWTYVKTLDTKS